ncbi:MULTISPECIES: AAA domain-containing protein [unclassified Amycolatopsis]|uniref:DEAD/DEAH box helicase n=1 Tax=unclassified Amycolatopsis TaxID=2618356 RepID=UPI0028769B9A|nr:MULTISPECIES: AAA domain-containing protein [unclassified Amycolatopsis]MDS0135734.1 AAA family ATPase [Amycolatopsis sp. 505]MDS0145665.1 AAA family ATPase [Amycolatopsis sp. CM201R]
MLEIVDLPRWVVLVPAKSLDGRLERQRRDHPGLPAGIGRVAADLAARSEGVPATLSPPQRPGGDPSLLLHTHTYLVRLFVTQYGDAYTIAGITPIRLRDHDRLARGCLLLRTAWHTVFERREIPPGSSAHWPRIEQAWAALHRDRERPVREVPAHTRFLDRLDEVIDTDQQLAANRSRSAPAYPYRAVETVGERRYTGSPVYVLRVVGGRVPDRDRFVQVRGEPEQRGQVTRTAGDRVTVRFDQPISWERLAQQGELELSSSDVVYAKQREAVALLRTGRTRNRSLLPVLVDHRVQPYRPVPAQPGEELDEDQLAAFRNALGVPDLLVVLGPPGTGKTRTISQIAQACALAPERGPVLVASHTNRAVDNVLAKLPADVVVVRVGNEGKVDASGRPFLLERLAAELRAEVLATTAAARPKYAGLPNAGRWAQELGRRIGELGNALGALRAAANHLAEVRRHFGGPAQEQFAAAVAALTRQQAKAAKRQDKVNRLAQRDQQARARPPWPGFLAKALAQRRARLLAAGSTELAGLRQAADRLRGAVDAAGHALDLATRDVPEVQLARQALQEAGRRTDERRAGAMAAAHAVRVAVGPADALPVLHDDGDAEAAMAGLARFHQWLGPRLALLEARAKLLDEWHEEASGAVEQLYPELIRYADVIGATCIGAASRPEIAEVEFDLAIVDEAGQISVNNLLVPLVRAERTVLVGDDRQLPPFVDDEVEAWADRSGDPAFRDLVTKSALEVLVGHLPESHVVQLRQQRRMPKVIADFISETFYRNTLKTMVERDHEDPLFASPLAFADTSGLSAAQRAETPARDWDPRLPGGTVNLAEARLLSELAAFYHRRHEEWALIVPYAAQVKLVKELLRAQIPEQDTIDTNVGTVDSFQGGERDVILYGFTRSNRSKNVGFLRELRRANVAFTRAKQQLVLIGDLAMLRLARDGDFRELARSLGEHAAAAGDVRSYQDIARLLDDLRDAS